MAVVEVILQHLRTEEEFPLLYSILDHSAAHRWLTYLEIALREDSPIEEHRLVGQKVRGRFVGFPGTDRTPDQLSALINECIDKINAFAPNTFKHRASAGMDQDTLNWLHKYFEIYRGPVLNPGEIYQQGTPEIKKALEDYNIYIHEFEDLHRVNHLLNDGKSARVDIVFLGNRTRHELYDEDFEHFRFGHEFGDLTAHYCEVGKQIYDVYRDIDEVVGEDNIRPFKYISADFDIFLGRTLDPATRFTQRTDLDEWMISEGFKPWDPKTSIGHLVLGRLIPDARIRKLSQEQLIRQLDQFWNVKEVKVHR